MQAIAISKYIRFSAQKGQLVADLVRGLQVGSALDILTFNPRRAAKAIKKTLESAIANAEHNLGANIDDLYISKIMVSSGPMLKRMRARAKGRGDRIEKRSCHITVEVSDTQPQKRKNK